MSYIEGNRVQSDLSGTEIPSPFPAGVITLMEATGKSGASWQAFHFLNLDELQAWAPDAEQFIEPAPAIPYRRPRAAANA